MVDAFEGVPKHISKKSKDFKNGVFRRRNLHVDLVVYQR